LKSNVIPVKQGLPLMRKQSADRASTNGPLPPFVVRGA
jgi:hypothetical protein